MFLKWKAVSFLRFNCRCVYSYPLYSIVLGRWKLSCRWRNRSSERLNTFIKIMQIIRMFLVLKPIPFPSQHIASEAFQHSLVHICLWNTNKIGSRMIMHHFLLAAWFPFGLLQLGSGYICMVILTQERNKPIRSNISSLLKSKHNCLASERFCVSPKKRVKPVICF